MLSVLRRHLPLGSRADAVELLDSGRLSPREVEENLADLARLNRLPGVAIEESTELDDSPRVLA